MKAYNVTYGIYLNCSIRNTRDLIVRANDMDEAGKKAKELAEALETVLAAEWRSSDDSDLEEKEPEFWAAIEDLYEIETTEE